MGQRGVSEERQREKSQTIRGLTDHGKGLVFILSVGDMEQGIGMI